MGGVYIELVFRIIILIYLQKHILIRKNILVRIRIHYKSIWDVPAIDCLVLSDEGAAPLCNNEVINQVWGARAGERRRGVRWPVRKMVMIFKGAACMEIARLL